MEPITKKEAIDNLRIAVKATLLVVPQHEYRVWAKLYLQQTEPRTEGLDAINDMANDSIAELAGWQPWSMLGRARECWFIIRNICRAHQSYIACSYNNATLEALDAAKRSLEVVRQSEKQTLGFVRDLERSLYGEELS